MNQAAVGNLVAFAGLLIILGGITTLFGLGWTALVGGFLLFAWGLAIYSANQ